MAMASLMFGNFFFVFLRADGAVAAARMIWRLTR